MKNSSVTHLEDPNAMAARLMQSAHNRDGLPEISVGLMFLFCAASSYAQVMLPQGSTGFKAAVIIFSLLLAPLCFGAPWALKWVRRRYLMERLGYVQYKPMGRKQIVTGIAFGLVMAVALFGLVPRFSQPDRWLLAGTGLFGGALGAVCGRLPRFVIGGVLMAATGMLLAFSGVSLPLGFAILFGLQGTVTFISGGVVFLRFLRQPIETGEYR